MGVGDVFADGLPFLHERIGMRLGGGALLQGDEVPHQKHDERDDDHYREDGEPGIEARVPQRGVQQRPRSPPNEDAHEIAHGGHGVGHVHRQLAVAYLVCKVAPRDGVEAREPEHHQRQEEDPVYVGHVGERKHGDGDEGKEQHPVAVRIYLRLPRQGEDDEDDGGDQNGHADEDDQVLRDGEVQHRVGRHAEDQRVQKRAGNRGDQVARPRGNRPDIRASRRRGDERPAEADPAVHGLRAKRRGDGERHDHDDAHDRVQEEGQEIQDRGGQKRDRDAAHELRAPQPDEERPGFQVDERGRQGADGPERRRGRKVQTKAERPQQGRNPHEGRQDGQDDGKPRLVHHVLQAESEQGEHDHAQRRASGRYHAERQVRSKVGVAERAQHVGMEKGEYPRPVRRKGRDAQDHAHRAAADEHVAMRRFTPPPDESTAPVPES